MTIDWLTVGAQIVNFLVLVCLLKRFLYGPIVAAWPGARSAIAERLRERPGSKDEAEAEARRLQETAAELERQRGRSWTGRRGSRRTHAGSRCCRRRVRRPTARRRQWHGQLERGAGRRSSRDVRQRTAEQFVALARAAPWPTWPRPSSRRDGRRASLDRATRTRRTGGSSARPRSGDRPRSRSSDVASRSGAPASCRQLTRALRETFGEAPTSTYEHGPPARAAWRSGPGGRACVEPRRLPGRLEQNLTQMLGHRRRSQPVAAAQSRVP